MDSTNSLELDSYLDVEERENRGVRRHTAARLVVLILKHPWPLFAGVFMIGLGTLGILLEPRIFGYAIDEAIVPKRWDRLKMSGALFFVVTALRTIASISSSYSFEVLGQRVTQDLRLTLFSHLQRMPVSELNRHPAGRLLTRVTNDIAGLNEMFSAGFVTILCNVLLVFGILAGLVLLDFRLTWITLGVLPILIIISVHFSRRLKIAYRSARSRLSAVNAFLAENLSGMKTVHLFNRNRLHLNRFDKLNEWYASAQVGSIRIFALFQPTITLAAGISIALMIGFGGRETLNGDIKLGVLVAFFSYVLSLYQPIREIADKWNILLSGIASAERVFAILEWKTEIAPDEVLAVAVPIENLRGNIIFENVWFAYEGENWVLKDFSVEISAGEKIGIVGHTGAGKTTFVNLITRFYEPQRGRILLDGRDLRHYDIRALRASIGIIQQDVFLFYGSFEDNVTFWNESKKGTLAARMASLGQPARCSEIVQERGCNFSMGERQVIAFLRAMVADPKIWILDEATANMDSTTEANLQCALEKASKNQTSIVIAHRLATVRSVNRVFVIHNGSLIETGDHNSLMSKDGLYARLFRYQNADQNVQ